MNIAPIAFVDTWSFASTLFARYKDRFVGDHHSMTMLPLRSEEGPLPILSEWKSAKALLSKIRTAAAPFMDGKAADLGAAALIHMKPGGFMEWTWEGGEYAQAHCRFHLCVVPAPGCAIYSGGESGVLPVGMLTYVNRLVLHSAVNHSDTPAIHLVVDLQKPVEG